MNIEWLCGFINGEGCFFINTIKNKKSINNFYIQPKIMICLHRDEKVILDEISRFLIEKYKIKPSIYVNNKCCIIFILGVENCFKMIDLLKDKMLGKKLYNIKLFSKAINILYNRKNCHTNKEDFDNIVSIKNLMNK